MAFITGEQGDEMTINIANDCISNSTDQNIWGVIFDNKLNFNTYVLKLCKKAGQKIHALARTSNFMSLNQRKLIMNAFISSQLLSSNMDVS